MIYLKATTTNISSKGIAKIYQDDIWKLHGIPKKVLSNRGLQFASKFMEESQKHWEQKDNYRQYTILKQIVKLRESIKK